MGNTLPVDVYLEDQLVNGYEMRYVVKKDVEDGINKLIIKKAEVRDSGLFRCIDKSGDGLQVDGQLTVVEPPECHSSVNASCELEGMENVTLTCSVNFSGKTHPTIEWIHKGGKMGGANSISSSDKVESHLTVSIEQGCSYSSPYICLSVASNSACTIKIQHNCTGESTGTPIPDPVKPDDRNIAAIVAPIVVVVIIIIGIIAYVVSKYCFSWNHDRGRNYDA